MRNDFLPTASWSTLRLRADLLRRVRAFFEARGFLEVETPILSADVVVDRHLDPFHATLCDDPRQPDVGRRLWLQTSPEFHMKRLLASGAPPIFQVARVFRNAERGAWHNPEFTMIEWYRPGDDMPAGMQLLSDLCEVMLDRGPAERMSYAEAFERYAEPANLSSESNHSALRTPHSALHFPHTATPASLSSLARSLGITIPASFATADRDAWLDLLLIERIEPQLGRSQPTILHDYPASQAALARIRPGEPPVAERFELYVDGVELANGYHELLDPQVLRERNRTNNALRVQDGKPALPEESRLLAAMEQGLPSCTGVALGFDRLVMLACGAKSIEQVLAFPIERA